jgi:hypothetical protein
MPFEMLKAAINLVSALAAFAAAHMWYKSAAVNVPHEDKPNPRGVYPAAIVVDENDFVATAFAQARWNKRGAFAAAIAALLQGIVLLLPSGTAI